MDTRKVYKLDVTEGEALNDDFFHQLTNRNPLESIFFEYLKEPKTSLKYSSSMGFAISTEQLVHFATEYAEHYSEVFADCEHKSRLVTHFGITFSNAFERKDRKDPKWFPHHCFMQQLLHDYLLKYFSEYHSGQASLRLTASVASYHLSGNGAAVVILGAPTAKVLIEAQLQPYVQEQKRLHADAADAFIALPLSVIIDAAPTLDLLAILHYLASASEATAPAQVRAWELKHHLRLACLLLMYLLRVDEDTARRESLSHWRSLCLLPDQCLLVHACRFPDAVCFDIGGGKRDLHETQWQSVVREVREETGLALVDTLLHPTPQMQTVAAPCRWIGYLHIGFLYLLFHYDAFVGGWEGVPDVRVLDRLYEDANAKANYPIKIKAAGTNKQQSSLLTAHRTKT